MAYVLGFFAADGNMVKNKRGGHFIAFYSNDKLLLDDVRRVLGSNHLIGKKGSCFQLQIGSKKIYSDLVHLGMSPAKSLTLQLPKDIPEHLQADFVRGYFDGDGCVYYKKIKFADRKNPRNVFQTLFTCGSRTFLVTLHELLTRHGICGGAIRQKNRRGK